MSESDTLDRDMWRELEKVPLAERYSDRNVYDMLQRVAREMGDRPALSFQLEPGADSPAVTHDYAAYARAVTQAANLFKSLGVDAEHSVGLLLPNLPQTAFAMLGAQLVSTVVPINPLLSPTQIAGILRDANVKVLVTLAPFPKTDVAATAAAAVAEAGCVTTVLEVDLQQYVTGVRKLLVPLVRPRLKRGERVAYRNFDRELSQQSDEPLTDENLAHADSVSGYFHTGGTTGLPKLARHRQRNMLFMAWVTKELLFRPTDVILCALPLFHVFAAYIMTVAPIAVGAHVVQLCPAGFRTPGLVANFWKLVERWRATFFVAVPTAFAALRQRPVDADVSTLRYAVSGSAPLPRELFRSFEEATGVKILEGYGQTESTCVISCNPPVGERRLGSVGFPIPYTEARAVRVDSAGAEPQFCTIEEVGEIAIRGPNVFAGYVREALNDELFLGEWLRTGDLGKVDAEGYLWITGRRKDVIIRGGHNIDPGVVEEALMSHPAVGFAAAIGQPDEKSGELPLAFVELIEGAAATPEELHAHAGQEVPDPAARPVAVHVMETLPKTVVGKVFKPALRKIAIANVLNRAFERAGVQAEVEVVDDPDLGLVAEIASADRAGAEAVVGMYAIPWRMVGRGESST